MFSIAMAASLLFTPADAHLAYETAKGIVDDCTPRDAGTYRTRRAARRIFDKASAAGIDAKMDTFEAITPIGPRRFVNVEGRYVSSHDNDWVVLVSHYDTKPGTDCPGANDGASTSGLLVALADALTTHRPKDINVLMIWTDGEECMERYGQNDGLWGSRHAAEKIKKEGLRVRAVVCLDMLGDADLGIVIPRNGTGWLAQLALDAGAAVRPGLVAAGHELVADDHLPFLEEGFDAIDLIDFQYGGGPGRNDYWHTAQDTMDKISEESLLLSGRVVAELLNRLAKRKP